MPGEEITADSLGHGFSVAGGFALGAKINRNLYAVYDDPVRKMRFMGYETLPIENIRNYRRKIIIALFNNILKKDELLKNLALMKI